MTVEEFENCVKEEDVPLKETDEVIKKLANLFTGQWGKIIDSLAESGILEIMRERGIKVNNLARELESHKYGHHFKLDFLLSSENEVVIEQVRTTLRANDVKGFLKNLKDFLLFYPYYKGFKIYGAMIGIRIEQKADKFAYRNGLFVFKVDGEGMLKILNDIDFKPKDFSFEIKNLNT